MQRLQPKHIIIPSILLTALLFLSISRSVYGYSNKPQQEQSADILIQTNTSRMLERYPSGIQRWTTEITNACNLFGLDPNLIAAVMLMESGGQPDVISHSGAVGLMQIMPKDGIAASFTCINGPCFQDRPSTSQLIDPTYNIEYGVKMLSQLIKHTGSLRSALYAYGPMDVGYSYADNVLSIYNSY